MFHLRGQYAIFGPDIELPFMDTDYTRQYHAGMNANSHVDVDVFRLANITENRINKFRKKIEHTRIFSKLT